MAINFNGSSNYVNFREPERTYTRYDISTPDRISFAGIDDNVEFASLHKLNNLYNLEFGILVHPEKHGTHRYPSKGFLMQLVQYNAAYKARIIGGDYLTHPSDRSFYFCMHLCGEYLDALFEDGYTGLEHFLPAFSAVQFNIGDRVLTDAMVNTIEDWTDSYGLHRIVQVSELPNDDKFPYLLDRSRGKGIYMDHWPAVNFREPNGRLRYRDNKVTFAGGLNASNIIKTCYNINRQTDWYNLDMETGVRDSANEFSLDKCFEICELVWGGRRYEGDEVIYNDEVNEVVTDEALEDTTPETEDQARQRQLEEQEDEELRQRGRLERDDEWVEVGERDVY
jgi:hypothetical protein